MTQNQLELISDRIELAHARVQENFDSINPVVGLSRQMRKIGFDVDTLTIDCLKTRRRIILLLHDDAPNVVRYQFALVDTDPDDSFKDISVDALTVQTLYDWMAGYFSEEN